VSLLLRRATLPDAAGAAGGPVDVTIDGGRVTAIEPSRDATEATAVSPGPGHERVVDLDGRLLLPAFAEPHAHLDKAFLAELVPNPTGDLMGAIRAMDELGGRIEVDDIVARAGRAVRLLVANGVTAIRTHVDLIEANGMRSLDALLEVRDRVRELVTIQICGLTGWPSVGAEGAAQRAQLTMAIERGIDLVGGCPHLERDPSAANAQFLDIAADAGLPLDLHTDETLDPGALGLEDLARQVLDRGFAQGVTASHCVSLSMQTEDRQRQIAALVAEAGIGVVALPQTNLFLQGHGHPTGMPRGLTALRALREAGVHVAAGADNLQDPFNPVGRGDPLETAALMVMAGHLLPGDALASVSAHARCVMGVPGAVEPLVAGALADLVAIPASSVREAVAMGPPGRVVVRAGQVVAGA